MLKLDEVGEDFPLSHACVVRVALTPIATIDRRVVRLPLCEAPCGLPRERAWSRILFCVMDELGFNSEFCLKSVLASPPAIAPFRVGGDGEGSYAATGTKIFGFHLDVIVCVC